MNHECHEYVRQYSGLSSFKAVSKVLIKPCFQNIITVSFRTHILCFDICMFYVLVTYFKFVYHWHWYTCFYIFVSNCFWYMYDELFFFIFMALNNKPCLVFSTSVPGCLIENTNLPPSMLAPLGNFSLLMYLEDPLHAH